MKVFKYVLKAPNSELDTAYLIWDAPIQGLEKILDVQMQGKDCVMWAAVNTVAVRTPRVRVYSVGTGHGAISGSAEYLTTIQDRGFVWHIFYTLQ
jgi:hypothetical protein